MGKLFRKQHTRVRKKEDAWSFRHALEVRLAQFNLTLHPEKIRLLRFVWFAVEDRKTRGEGKPETFDFLGFTHFCDQTKSGMFVVGRVSDWSVIESVV
jgi:RNA-directed DNA polymerase